MAKADSTSSRNGEDLKDKIAGEIRELAREIEFVHSTALCVQLALLHQNAICDQEIAQCVDRHIASELVRLGDVTNDILTKLGSEPYNSPLFRSAKDGNEVNNHEDDE